MLGASGAWLWTRSQRPAWVYVETAFKGKRHFLFYLQLNHNRKVTEAPEWGSGVAVTWKQVPAVTTGGC